MSKEKYIVKMEKVTKKFSKTTALDNIDLNLKHGKIIGLLGPNGSGKSTLLKSIMGLIKPDKGKILIDGRPPGIVSKKQISYLPEINYLYDWMTVSEIISFVSGFYHDWNHDRVIELLDFMGLDEDKKIKQLSKGMRGRLKLVISMARDSSLVLLDEPLSGIDPPSRARILETVVSEYKAGKQTILLSTHVVTEAESVFEDVIFIQKGKIKLYDSTENLRSTYKASIQTLWEEVYAS